MSDPASTSMSSPTDRETVEKESKLIEDVAIGDQLITIRVVKEKRETAEGWVLIYEDGTTESFDRASAPAVMVSPAK